MSEIIITVDEQDAILGHYFEQSKQYLYDYLIDSKNTLPIKIVGSNNCHQTYLEQKHYILPISVKCVMRSLL